MADTKAGVASFFMFSKIVLSHFWFALSTSQISFDYGGEPTSIKSYGIPTGGSSANISHNSAFRIRECSLFLSSRGFGDHGVRGMMLAAKYARENDVPFLRIWLGMKISVIEFTGSLKLFPLCLEIETEKTTPEAAKNTFWEEHLERSSIIKVGWDKAERKENAWDQLAEHHSQCSSTLQQWHRDTFKKTDIEIARLQYKLQNLLNKGNTAADREHIASTQMMIDKARER
ncbi:hypothetical protein RJT34_25098 [Clitoria ternatea]|uniref:CTP synthase (glutamine hydrolyzing) n=1 Tax=Clitoria ternatea TaxID=43366 RepID=A0AAN9FRX9_CLITE